MGVTTGPMFRVSTPSGAVKRATISHLDSLFHDIMKRVQFHRPDLVAPEVKAEDEFSARRLLRRGATTEAQNRKIPAQVIEANNRWKKHIWANGILRSMSMWERYTDAKASVKALIQFSELM
ncbi:hypothetical protein ACA910_003034 [Epithemia clementina (nom. ined.)]